MKIQHNFDFDPTCGYTPEALRAIAPPETEPADFADFWSETFEEAARLPLEYRIRELWSPDDSQAFYEIRAKGWDGVEIGMWLRRPRQSRGGVVVGHGYGNMAWFEFEEPELTVIMPCSRGLGLSRCRTIPWEADRHVVHGIESRERCVHRGAAADLWLATTILLDQCPDCADNLNYHGASYGGGMGALMLPWDRRFRTASLGVPTFGNNPLRLMFPSNGSGEAVRRYYLANPEAAMAVLPYFDAANAARYLRIPTLVEAAYFDPCVLPVGQFAVANAVPEQFRLLRPVNAGHYPVPEDRPLREEIRRERRRLFGLDD